MKKKNYSHITKFDINGADITNTKYKIKIYQLDSTYWVCTDSKSLAKQILCNFTYLLVYKYGTQLDSFELSQEGLI